MTRNVWHKRFHGDALNGYMGLTLEQRGAYTTFLDLLYNSDWSEGLPDRDRWFAGHMNVSVRKWRALLSELVAEGKIDVTETGLLSNKRYRKERENALETSRKRAESGASGGDKSGEARRKSNENNDRPEASASDLPLYACATESESETEKIRDDANASSRESEKPRRGKRLAEDWKPRPLPDTVATLVAQWPPGRYDREVEGFVDFWTSTSSNAAKLDWDKTWHNRIRDQHDRIMRENRNGTGRNGNGANLVSNDGFLNAINEAAFRRSARQP